MDKKKPTAKEKKLKRTEELAKKKAVDDAVKMAYMKEDHLVDFPVFVKFDHNGISADLESGSGEFLTFFQKQFIQGLLKINMEGPYGLEWSVEEKVKRRGMTAINARYIFVRLNQSATLEGSTYSYGLQNRAASCQGLWQGPGNPVVAFVQYRFVVEEDLPVLYVYEIQLEELVRGKGLGKFLMQLLELIAHRNNMKAVLLTVQKRNVVAMNFYRSKLGYRISSVSPSRVDPVAEADSTYEILCKTFDSQAKSILEDGIYG